MTSPRRVDPTERAHLRDAQGFAPPVHRFAPRPELADVVRRYWLPVWSLPPGETSVQRVLQYPVCLVVVMPDSALLVGPTTGLSTRTLEGSGWAAGAMLQPAAGFLLAGRPVSELTDTAVPLDDDALATEVRAAMAPDPASDQAQAAAAATLDAWLTRLLPVDKEGLLVNAVVEHVETDREVQRVSQVCEKFDLTERTLQRLTARRIGLTPKWLVQRRRLHEAAEALALPPAERPDLARVAADLGYADQAHFSRDFRAVTGMTPGEFAAEPR